MLMLGLGIAEYSSFIEAKNAVQAAAREGAREAIRSTATNSSVQSAIDSVMSSQGLQGSGYTITLSPATMLGLPSGQQISVTVACTWANVGLHALPPGMGAISNSKQIAETIYMDRE